MNNTIYIVVAIVVLLILLYLSYGEKMIAHKSNTMFGVIPRVGNSNYTDNRRTY